jgi:hypothetical protein
VTSHGEVVVGTPDDDFAAATPSMPSGIGRMVGVTFEISKNPISVFAADAVEKCMEMGT